MRISVAFLFVLYCCLSACRNDAPPTASAHIYADYYIRYLAPTRQLRAEARFMEGAESQTGTPKLIGGGINFQGYAMQKLPIKDNHQRYLFIDTMDFPPEFLFQYENGGADQRQSLAMAPLESFRINGPVSKQSGLNLITDGGGLKGNESLALLIIDAQNRVSSFTIDGPAAGALHHLPPDFFTGLQLGDGAIYVVKRMKKTIEQADQTISATIEYYTDTLQVRIVE